jgi:hypothetical protein
LKEKIQRDKRQLKLANVFPRRNHMEKKKDRKLQLKLWFNEEEG